MTQSLHPSVAELYAAESATIRQEFESSGDGPATILARSRLVDPIVLHLYQELLPAGPSGGQGFCLVAVGGYGRQELFPCSDIDLLLLSETQRVQDSRREAWAAILRTLWDTGLRVGGGPRTLAECYQLHRDNLQFTISLLDSRYLAGDREVFNHLRGQAIPHVVARDYQELVRNLAEMTHRRHERHARTIFHLEPNLKEAPGGLRDHQVARWLTLISELAERGRWTPPEQMWSAALREASRAAFEFLSAARCFLHYQQGRDDNLLTYELQERTASFGIGDRSSRSLSPAEWMRNYFRHVRSIYQLTSQVIEEVAPSRSSLYGLFQDWRSRLSNADFSVLRGRIYPRHPAAAVEDLRAVLSLFEMMARHGLELSREAERWVQAALLHSQTRGSGPPVTEPASAAPEVWRQVRQILVLPHAAGALRAMHQLGLLVALFPEFRVIDALVTRDFYHRYTVDEHSFMTIQSLHALGRPGAQPSARERTGLEEGKPALEWQRYFAEIFSSLEQPELLFLALLFHDVGKGMACPDHIHGSLQAVEEVFRRLGLDSRDRETVRFLISNHLEMSATFQRRDIFDAETIRSFAEKAGTIEQLKMLCLFTYADIKSVSPEALTPWRAEMLWRLYTFASNYLTRSVDEERLRPARGGISKVELVLLLLPPASMSDLNAFLEGFPKRYLETHSPEDIATHFEKARQLSQNAVQLILRRRDHFHELTVLTPDRPFLFASLTGALAAWGMNILKAEAFSNAAGTVLDTFCFTDLHRTLELNPSEVPRFERSVVDVLSGQATLETLLSGRLKPEARPPLKVDIPTQVRFDDTSSSHSTLLELITWDRPGLLYQVSRALAELGCNIEVALIDTEGQKVIDTFYLTVGGAKLPADLQGAIRGRLLRLDAA